MSKLRKEAPPEDPIERDFLDAIERLLGGEPKNKKLKARKANGTLKVNVANVALEAGHSRTLIALETGCRYPRVRELVKQTMAGKKTLPTTLSEVNANQRAVNVDLQARLKIYQATILVHFKARERAERDAARESAAASRLRKQVAQMGNVVSIVNAETG